MEQGRKWTMRTVSPKESDRRRKEKMKLERKILRESTVLECARVTKGGKKCTQTFTPRSRMDQIYCSERCSMIAGRVFYEQRNKIPLAKKALEKKNIRYKEDPLFREKAILRASKNYHLLTPDKKLERSRAGRAKDPEKTAKYARDYQNYRNATDLDFRIAGSMRSRIRMAMKNCAGKKAHRTEVLLGCTILDFREYLSSQFKEGMSFDNYGEWEIDHIRPVQDFINCNNDFAVNVDVQKECFNFKNTQPLWKTENQRKGAKWITHENKCREESK